MNVGNKFTLFDKGGRPPMYKSTEEIQGKIQEYFNNFISETPNPALGKRPTVTGLALFLGFESRQSLYDYKKNKPEFTYIIKRATLAIEMNYEQMLDSKSVAGSIFALKNMGWMDRKDITSGGKPIKNVDKVKLEIEDYTE